MKTFYGTSSISAKIESSDVTIDSKDQSGVSVTEFEVSTIPSNALLDIDGTPVLDANGNYILID